MLRQKPAAFSRSRQPIYANYKKLATLTIEQLRLGFL
jgi:hypothetical protein